MFKIILSALASFAQFLFRGIIVKFFVFFGLFYITTEFVPLVIEMFIPASLVLILTHYLIKCLILCGIF